MNKTSIFLGLTAFVLAGAILAPQAVEAYRGDPAVKGPNYTEERHEAMEKAIANKDVAAVKKLMQGKGVAYRLGDDTAKWNRFVEMQSLMHSGKTAEANKIRTELGLGLQNGTGKGQGMGYGRTSR